MIFYFKLIIDCLGNVLRLYKRATGGVFCWFFEMEISQIVSTSKQYSNLIREMEAAVVVSLFLPQLR